VAHHGQQTDAAGRFGRAVYHLRLPPGLALGPCPGQADTAVTPTPRRGDHDQAAASTATRRQRNPDSNHRQLNLLDPNP
jgi:hypothetical protein